MVADWTVRTDMLGEEGPSPLDGKTVGLFWPLVAVAVVGIMGFLEWHVAVEMAVASEMGMRQRPLPWRYCMAEPMSSSMSLATWCSVTVMLSLGADDAVWLALALRPTLGAPPLALLVWIQSPPPYQYTKPFYATIYNKIIIGLFFNSTQTYKEEEREKRKRWESKAKKDKKKKKRKSYCYYNITLDWDREREREREIGESEKVGTRAAFVLFF